MNKEINKIIAKLEGCFGIFDYLLTPVENNLLVSYIKSCNKKNKQLQERIEYLERSNNRREDTILEQRQEISDLEDNWNKLKEYLFDIRKRGFALQNLANVTKNTEPNIAILIIINKMQELEQGSNNQ